MNETEQALRQALNQDRLCHIDMIDSLDRGFAQILLQEPEGLLTYDAACQKYGLTAKSPAFVEKALALCQPERTLVCHQDWLLAEAAEQLNLERMAFTTCRSRRPSGGRSRISASWTPAGWIRFLLIIIMTATGRI